MNSQSQTGVSCCRALVFLCTFYKRFREEMADAHESKPFQVSNVERCLGFLFMILISMSILQT